MLNQDAHHSSPSDLTDIDIHDKDDLIILSSAINGNADIFITGDKERAGNHLRPISKVSYAGINLIECIF